MQTYQCLSIDGQLVGRFAKRILRLESLPHEQRETGSRGSS
jgi:hypothetical protein